MHDVGYVAAGYAVTLAMLAAYRWRLAVRTRRAQRYLSTATGRTGAATGRTGAATGRTGAATGRTGSGWG